MNNKIQSFYRILNRKKKTKISKNNEDKINNDIIIKSKIELSDVTRKQNLQNTKFKNIITLIF